MAGAGAGRGVTAEVHVQLAVGEAVPRPVRPTQGQGGGLADPTGAGDHGEGNGSTGRTVAEQQRVEGRQLAVPPGEGGDRRRQLSRPVGVDRRRRGPGRREESRVLREHLAVQLRQRG